MELLNILKKLNADEIREMIVASEGKERIFYVDLYNHILKLRREDTLREEELFGNYNKVKK